MHQEVHYATRDCVRRVLNISSCWLSSVPQPHKDQICPHKSLKNCTDSSALMSHLPGLWPRQLWPRVSAHVLALTRWNVANVQQDWNHRMWYLIQNIFDFIALSPTTEQRKFTSNPFDYWRIHFRVTDGMLDIFCPCQHL